MFCHHCNNTINGKPWIIYENEDGSVKNICGYICSRRCSTITSYNYKHIVNKEDFTFDLIPIIPRKEELKLFSIDEISRMNNFQRTKYDDHLKRMFEQDEGNIKLYEDHMEIEASYKEQENAITSEEDDY
tara:strand:+ start:106 stop:495 length:390 start_codon:yes stop_codon:yes gene_type:complete